MSAAQSRFWRHEVLSERTGANNSLATLELSGPLDIGRFAAALASLVTRHEILRTRFEALGAQAVQIIEQACRPRFSFIDLSDVAQPGTVVETLRRQALIRSFDLNEPPLFECLLLKTAPGTHFLLFVIHHIISDDWAQQLLIEEWVTTYLTGSPPGPAQPVPQYSRFVTDELQYLSSADFTRDRNWWAHYLAEGIPTQLSIETVGIPGQAGAKHFFKIDGVTTTRLVGVGSRHQASLANVLLAGLLQTLHERTRQSDFLIGLMSGLRLAEAYERTLGCMVNVLCLRAKFDAQPSVGEWIRSVRDNYLDVADHARFPVEQAMSLLPSRAGGPVEVVYVAQPARRSVLSVPGLTLRAVEMMGHVPAFPLVVMSTQDEQGVSFSLEYDTAVFDESQIAAFAEHLCWTLTRFAQSAEARTAEIGRAFLESVSPRFPSHGPRRTSWLGRTIHGLFEEGVSRHSQAVAIDGPRGSITYAGLDAWADEIARQLTHSRGIAPGDVVALACHRSIAQVAAWIGILKAGAICLVIDPDESEREIRRRLQQADTRLVLTEVPGRLPEEPGKDGEFKEGARAAHQPIAYVCFTSGSTGTPGAVLGMHGASVNRLLWLQETCPVRMNERCLVRTSPAFVDSVAEVFGPLCAGATLILCPEATASDPESLPRLIREWRVERITLVPTLLRSLLPALSTLGPEPRTWHVSGEPLPADVARELHAMRPRDVLLNLYGSAEVAADVTASIVPANSDDRIHVGRAISNCSVQVLDAALVPVPSYVEGDLYVGGVGLSVGYLSDAARTADRFIPSPDGVGERLYRTGDRGFWRADGNLLITGRRDRQIKRHGVRIALDGIECRLECLTGIAAAAVFWSRDATAMVALIVLSSPAEVPGTRIHPVDDDPMAVACLTGAAEQQLWATIADGLPATALPDRAFVVDRLPRTPGGKIRYERLERIPWHSIRLLPEDPAASTTGETERLLLEICERILRKSTIRPTDRFLEMGMSSLQLVQLLHAIAEAFSIRLKLSQLYAVTSLRKCAELIDVEVESVASFLQELV